MKYSRSEFVVIDGLRIHVRRWGREGAPLLFMVHGWMDCSATFQFVVDALKQDWDIVAPDWRGYGLSEWQNRSYWYPDDLADLELLLKHYSPDQPVNLVSHSMGASIASLFAGLRPSRVARLVMLESYGIPPQEEGADVRLIDQWMQGRNQGVQPQLGYLDRAEYAKRLMAANPRLTAPRAAFLAENFGRINDAGRVVPDADPWRRLQSPCVATADYYMRVWRDITAPVLWIAADDSYLFKRFANKEDEYRRRLASLKPVEEIVLKGIGHNLHHDVPEQVAAMIEDFLI